MLLEGADHSDPRFFSENIKAEILDFLDKTLKS